jgi:glycosyltransferase involved in cell wall biosynthesis
LYNARNLAIKKSKGSLITFLDADDWWLKNKLTKQVQFIQKNKDLNVIYSNLFLFDETKNKTSLFSKEKLYNGNITQSLLNNFKMPILTTMIRKKIFSKYRFENKYNIIGDFDLFIRISLKEKIFSIQEPLAFYRIHDSNMTTSKIDINIQELENWLYRYSKKKYFKKYNFLKVKKIIQTLKVKNYFISGKIVKALSELFKSPFNLYNLKYIYFLILPENLIKKL